ncbi:MAG: ATP-binding protein [Thermodesulfobacteriota bacterium]|nr:ATP-binding protein [Thermodesulfobacteriota bacterium]
MVEILKSRHSFLDFVQVAFVLTDIHTKILYTNRYTERLFGYTREEIEGQRIRTLFLEEDLTYFLPNIVYLTLYRGGFEGEALLRQKDGKRLFAHLSTASFKEEGEVFLTFSLQEIQRLKKLEKEKLEMEHRTILGLMVEEIAHQVRNPILSIGGYAQRLIQTSTSLPKSKVYLDRILRETNRLEMMIRRMEEVVQIQRPVFQKENILEVVERALQSVSQKQTAKGITFNLETGSLKGDEHFYIGRDLVTKALSHILENSIESVGKMEGRKGAKRVKVLLACDEGNVEIFISDRGEGISKKNLHHIFDPFYSTRPERVGLGLTFVKRVVEEHGGRIQIESRLKRGTTVVLTFPKDRRRKIRREFISPEAGHPLSSP